VRMSRRGFLGTLGGTALAAASFGPLLLPRPSQTAELLRSRVPLPKPFTVPLPIPPVAKPIRTDGTTDFYRIVQREVEQEILPGLRTRILSYDGSFPGPTLVGRRGRRMVVTHRNELSVPTVVHLHGGHTPADSDGFPMDLVAPQGERTYTYPGSQRAATLWYHDHRMDFTGPQVYRGLAGFHIVTDEEDDALPLPKGARDIPLMIADRAFDMDGSLRYPSLANGPGVEDDYMEGVLGDVILVNGAPWPVLEVDAARYRLRILNAANARRFQLRIDPGMPWIQVGSDGGLLEKPLSHNELVVAPAERFDVVLDFSGFAPGTELTVHNGFGSGSTADVLRFRVVRRASDDSHVPDRLSSIERLDPAKAVRTREWRFRRGNTDRAMWLINDAPFDHHGSSAAPRLGEVEIWRFSTDLHHPVHVHLDPFQVIERHGAKPGPYDSGWKDTVDIGPTDWVDVAVRFTDYPGRYLLHCHNLEHEDMAMMAAFDVR
jgi:FtsP/CotA-like multicopper oxidase with cupredoxin domain